MKIVRNNLKYISGEDNTFRVMVQLDFLTGLRLGELTGLKKKFLVRYMAKVRNTLKRVKVFDSPTEWHWETKLIRPKSNSSIRNVNFPIPFWSTMELYLKEQEEKWKKNGFVFDDNALLFSTETCQPLDGKNFYTAWKRFLARIEIAFKKPHSMRDTYATTLIRRGALIHDVKDMLGHSSIKITEKYYIFVFPDDKSKTASLLDDVVV